MISASPGVLGIKKLKDGSYVWMATGKKVKFVYVRTRMTEPEKYKLLVSELAARGMPIEVYACSSGTTARAQCLPEGHPLRKLQRDVYAELEMKGKGKKKKGC